MVQFRAMVNFCCSTKRLRGRNMMSVRRMAGGLVLPMRVCADADGIVSTLLNRGFKRRVKEFGIKGLNRWTVVVGYRLDVGHVRSLIEVAGTK